MKTIVLCVLIVLGILGTRVSAQFQMPDPKQMAGIPRPVTDLPNGTVSVRLIRGQLSNNITNFPVELHVGSDVRTVKTDAAGRAEFGNLPAGAALKAVAVVDGERLESQEFPAPKDGGIRLMLVATDTSKGAAPVTTPAVTGQVTLGSQSRIIIEPGDDIVAVYYLLDIENNGKSPINPAKPFTFEMPAGAQGATAQVVEGSTAKASAKDGRVLIEGPFAPGRTMVQTATQLASGDASLQFSQRFPANIEQLAVIVKKVADTKLASPQIVRQQDMSAQGETFIAGTGGAVAAGQPIVLTLEDLPHHSPVPRMTALGLAAAVVLFGIWRSKRTEEGDARAAERKRLVARREKLLADLVRLEQERRAGKIADVRYESRREALLGSLEQVYGALDSDEFSFERAGTRAVAAGDALEAS